MGSRVLLFDEPLSNLDAKVRITYATRNYAIAGPFWLYNPVCDPQSGRSPVPCPTELWY